VMTRHMVVGVFIALAVVGVVSGQSQRSPATLDDLLAEMRGLRTDLNQSSSASVRTQLLVARLTLQEQRINALAGQLDNARRALSSKQGDPESPIVRLKRFEDAVQIPGPPEAQVEMERMLPRLRADAALWQREEQALRSQENELSVLLATEQNRWIDFNSRLDDLERALSR
jgi:chromosome segregation ATPase